MRLRMTLASVATAIGGMAFAAAPVLPVHAEPDCPALGALCPSDLAIFDGNATITDTPTLSTCHTGAGAAAVCWKGGVGSFTFNSTTCEYLSVSDTNLELPGGCTVTASGTFSNIVCGTGSVTAGATATITPNPGTADSAEGNTTVTFGITFAAGIGVVSGTAVEGDGGSGAVHGVVDIRAVPQLPDTADRTNFGACTPTFSVLTIDALLG